jgi:hypothetical protein
MSNIYVKTLQGMGPALHRDFNRAIRPVSAIRSSPSAAAADAAPSTLLHRRVATRSEG